MVIISVGKFRPGLKTWRGGGGCDWKKIKYWQLLTDLVQHTCLIGCHIKWHILLCMVFGQLWNPVDSLQQETVVGVWLQVGHHHRGVWQANTAWQKTYIGATFFQAPSIWQDPSAQDVVPHILSATCFHGDGPLQKDAGLIDIGDGVTRSRGRAWESWNEVKKRKWNTSSNNSILMNKSCSKMDVQMLRCYILTCAGHIGRVRVDLVVSLLTTASSGSCLPGDAVGWTFTAG